MYNDDLPTISPDGTAAIDRMFEAAVDRGALPGVVAAITNKDRILYLEAFGTKDVSEGTPMAEDTIFRIASMTKPVTSVAIMRLIETGQLRLDDPASAYEESLRRRAVISDFDEKLGAYATQPASCEITIRHLLTHTAGFAYDFTSRVVHRMQELTHLDALDLPLVFDPGSRWHYSSGTTVLGHIVCRLTGRQLEELYRDTIFGPLKMFDTSYHLSPGKEGRLAAVHRRTADGRFERTSPQTYLPVEKGGSGLLSTAADYMAFLRMLMNGGAVPDGSRVLEEETVRSMTSNQIGDPVVQRMPAEIPERAAEFPLGAGRDTFGFGFQITASHAAPARRLSAGSYSWGGINNTHFWVDPAKGIGACMFAQVSPFYDPAVIEVLLQFEGLICDHLR